MSYQVIARKWRPQSFADLKGQSAARRTLINAVANNRLHHALLFTGPRGTGKTSTARILAKILRCTNLKKDHTPCDKCEDCIEISAGRSLDVLEIDGASNNGVDSIRELRDQVSFNPSSGNAKIYIIDEVHMLSTSAFNALLKTLEEPPEGVYFIMATTEAHKLPKTILSRVQRYDFKPVSLKEVVDLMQTICEAEKVEYEPDALFLIAQMGEGSVRDSLSFLDQCITFSGGELTKNSVIENLGVTDIGHFRELLGVLIERDTGSLTRVIQTIQNFNIEPQTYLEELVVHIKNLILFKVDGENLKKVEDFSESEKAVYLDLSNRAELEDLYILFDICFKGTVQLARAFNPQVLLEVTLLKAGTAPFYNELSGGVVAGGAQPKASAEKPENKPKASRPHPKKMAPPQYAAPSPRPAAQTTKAPSAKASKASVTGEKPSAWKSFVLKLKSENPVVGAKLELCKYSFDKDSKTLSLSVDAKNSFLREQVGSSDFLSMVQKHLESDWGKGVQVVYGEGKDHKPSVQSSDKKSADEKKDQIKQQVEGHSLIKSMKEKYKVEITDIK